MGYYFDQQMLDERRKDCKNEDFIQSPSNIKKDKTPIKLWPPFGGSSNHTTNVSSILSTPK